MAVPSRKPYEASGRTNQKQRTRESLVAAARELVARGKTPTVDEAAAFAAISRTTAYRYFRTRAELLAAAHPETARTSLLPANPPADVTERLRLVLRACMKIIRETEDQQRTMLRLSLTPTQDPRELPLRQGRVIGWLEDALSPLRSRMSAAAVRDLAIAIRSAIGIESFVWLVDVAGKSRTEAMKSMTWAAEAMLEKAMREN